MINMSRLEQLENYVEGCELRREEVGVIVSKLSDKSQSIKKYASQILFMHYVSTVHRIIEKRFPDECDEDMLQEGYAALLDAILKHDGSYYYSIKINNAVNNALTAYIAQKGVISIPQEQYKRIQDIAEAVEIAGRKHMQDPNAESIYDALREINPELCERHDNMAQGDIPPTKGYDISQYRLIRMFSAAESFLRLQENKDPNAGIGSIPQTIRGEYRDKNIESALAMEHPAHSDAEREEMAELMRSALDLLDPKEKTILEKRYEDGKTLQEISEELGGEELGFSRGTIKYTEDVALRTLSFLIQQIIRERVILPKEEIELTSQEIYQIILEE